MNATLYCPACRAQLGTTRDEFGTYEVCPTCRGAFFPMSTLRQRTAGDLVQLIWRELMKQDPPRGAPCPACQRRMALLPLADEPRDFMIQGCRLCQFVWLRLDHFTLLPAPDPKPAGEQPGEPHEPDEADRMIAQLQVEKIRLEVEAERRDERRANVRAVATALRILMGG